MSLYSQNLYGQPSYGGPSYRASPPSSNGYYYAQPPSHPPAPPMYEVDAASFRRDFSTRLEQLTFNSRPIIQQLSMFAQDYARYADIVGQCVRAHIRRVPPWMKLPAFYLLDAISKNVYEPYARHFATFVTSLYLETYNQVDDNTRGKMEEMLLTWRTGSPSGKELFGAQEQLAIERGVWGSGSSSSSNVHSGPGSVMKSQVMSELLYALGQKERAVQSNPYDTMSQNHILVLQQLRMHVEAGVSQEELRQILNQLRNLVKSTAPPPPVPQPTVPSAPSWHSPPPPPAFLPQISQISQVTPPPVSYVQPVKIEEQPPASLNVVSPPTLPVPSTSAAPPSGNIANILSSLLKSGVLSTTGTPTGAGATAKGEDVPVETQEQVEIDEAVREYRDKILLEPINLHSLESTRPSLIVELLYEQQGLQCKQCGIRFPDTKLGKRRQDDHLDMHFRQNRKASDDLGRGHSRSWFTSVEDWIQDVSGAKKGKGRIDGSGPLNAKATAAAETAKREEDLRSQFVIVPPGEEAHIMSCPICKETLKSEFLEDDEEWVWKNATKKDDKIYHATCYAEAFLSTNSLAARLRSEKGHGSRSATPEVHPMTNSVRAMTPPATVRVSSKSPTQSPLSESKVAAGTKRKVEHFESNVTEEPSGTPPLKKVALTSVSS
uniref:CID domain-containing protein n=1 Tax=Psilocybe cubensis TaxID=181762 RepID=A0A8H8CJU9_PSICU